MRLTDSRWVQRRTLETRNSGWFDFELSCNKREIAVASMHAMCSRGGLPIQGHTIHIQHIQHYFDSMKYSNCNSAHAMYSRGGSPTQWNDYSTMHQWLLITNTILIRYYSNALDWPYSMTKCVYTTHTHTHTHTHAHTHIGGRNCNLAHATCSRSGAQRSIQPQGFSFCASELRSQWESTRARERERAKESFRGGGEKARARERECA